MKKNKTNFLIISILFAFFAGVIRANTISVQNAVECECFNTTASMHEKCVNNIAVCNGTDSDKASSCFVLWSTNNVTGEYKVSMKGCFIGGGRTCNMEECVDTSQAKKTNFCCCTGNRCNSEYRLVPTTTTKAPETEELTQPPKELSALVVILICCGAIFVVSVMFAGVYFYKSKKNIMFNEIPTNEPDQHGSNQALNQHRPIQLLEVKARGRYGAVWKALLKPNEIAVKIFPLQDKESWASEQEIFKLPRMNHPNILEFIGVEQHLERSEYWLITAYHNYGSLCDYLKAHTVTWSELCRIAETMMRGLMHLHEEIPATKTDRLKPAIAHRDFKSKNVLLKDDLTACIADFGLALIFHPDIPCGEAHGQVGTRRYMAPEVLEGAINFTRDAFLRIDVYACALVLWELVSRCTAHGGNMPEYSLPFESELNLHPTLEEMQENIVTKKLRPKIQEHWRSHSGLNAICDTIEECWDHDAEARLTASCVIERILQHTRYTKSELLIETNNDTLIKNPTD